MIKKSVHTALAIIVFLWATSGMAAPLGEKPAYLWGEISSVPNEQAIAATIWAPGLEEGYVPQGLSYAEGNVLVAAYRSTDTKIDKGPCRIFSVAAKTGKLNGFFDMPEECGHAGGVALIGKGTIVVADTRTLYKIDLEKALAAKNTAEALISTVKLAGGLKGSFVDFDGVDLWVGSSEKDESKARAHRLSLSVFDQFNGKPAIREDKALSAIPLPTEGNGMAFDAAGKMWIASSNSKYGALYRIEPKSGEILSRYDMVMGIEDLGFDENGKLWSVSEAGTRRWSKWRSTYPVLFQVDVQLLK